MNAEITSEIVTKVSSALDAIADKIGVGVNHFWPIFVQQQALEGYGLLIAFGFPMVIFILGSVASIILFKKGKFDSIGQPDLKSGFAIFFLVFALVALLVSVIGLGANATEVISRIVNPEYWALKDVIGMVK